ncbi:helix-turn-helix transcriptional regulator [Sphingomonas jatrophae]|uniref:AraC-type DNA-binding protein n=1 Tax=Sphingomonas jatrophae TaxID=1166337 RepID=A0A1I6KKU4_9SPHN|nr:AraC family transcriptional regulator [Sphingomonas jatrophae]SFR91875.1 AraC-type DNA-binding protein [Sphingomonas jatrophae]
MTTPAWRIVGEVAAGEMWAAVAEHPAVDTVDRTHLDPRTSIGLFLSAQPNASQGRFLASDWTRGHARMGRIVVVPGDLPLHVQAQAAPPRRMLHCRLPIRAGLPRPSGPGLLARCLDVRSPGIAASLARLAQEVAAPGFAGATLIEGLGLVVAAELARELAGAERPSVGGLAGWQLRRIDDHLAAGHWDCTISDLARLCGISAAHAMRAFRQSTGRSIAQHVAALRMARARDLLAGDAHDIAEIAALLRFASPSAFAAAFRRASGVSPGNYRRSIGRL